MLATKIQMAVSGLLSKAFGHGNTAGLPFRVSHSFELSEGTAAGQADRVFVDRRTLAASANEDLDLAGVLEDIYGQALTFAKVKSILIRHVAGVNNLVVGGAAATQFAPFFGAAAHTIVLPPTGAVMLARNDAAGWAVAAGASDFLRIANGGAGSTVTYEIVIVGTSA